MTAKYRLKRLYQRGDTIVEVLIAITIATAVLSLMYNIMNRNLLLSRESQERTEAAKIAQGQVELFKSYRDSGSVYTGTFCLSAASAAAITGYAASTPSPALPDNFANYPAGCKDTTGLYNYAVVANIGPDLGTYHFYVRWNRADGKGQDQVIMVYRR